MNNSKIYAHLSCYMFLSTLITNLAILFFPHLSVAGSAVRERRMYYESCAQLQKKMNIRNNPDFIYKGFEKAKLVRRSYVEFASTVYCNGGIIIDEEEKTICRGYIGYTYSPQSGIARYSADWGLTDGSPNFNDSNKGDYCKRIK
jgi:hypothetical protein